MSSVSEIYDEMVDLIESTLSTYKRLSNPYILEANNHLQLEKGFGITVGAGNRRDLHVGCKIAYERVFTVILTKKITATDHATTARETLEKNLLEDFVTLRVALEQNHTLDGTCIDMNYTADSGVQVGATGPNEENKYFTFEIAFLCLYEEALP